MAIEPRFPSLHRLRPIRQGTPVARHSAASRFTTAGCAITRRRARARAAGSPDETNGPARRATVSGIAPAVVAITGKLCAIASG